MQHSDTDMWKSQLELQRDILEMIANEAPLDCVLDCLCETVERLRAGSICSVMLLDESGLLRFVNGPSVTEDLASALDRLKPTNCAGSCGTAAHTREPVYVKDTLDDPRWADIRELAVQYGIRACWSVPIFLNDEQIVGTFAISHSEPNSPDTSHQRLLKTASHLAGIAIQRDRSAKERAGLEERLRQSQKLEAMGTLASGVAHDFNNLLMAMMGYSELLSDALDATHAGRPALTSMEELYNQATDLTRSLLTFSRNTGADRHRFSLTKLVGEAVNMLKPLLPAAIELNVIDNTNTDIWIEGDESQIRQVIINLAINARDAMTNGGGLEISVSQKAPADDSNSFGSDAGHAVIEVVDHGSGMSESVRERMFEPFFTTKARGHGTGLGLAITHGIVADHGGTIRVRSFEGEGTKVTVTFPCVSAALDAGVQQDGPTLPANEHSDSVLVAEDKDEVRAIIAATLRANGFHVIEAANGEDAVEQCRNHATNLKLLIMDIDLPRLDGISALRQIRERYVDVPAIIITGSFDFVHQPEGPHDLIMRKPFKMQELIRTIGGLLAASSPT
ncbi:MAG: ATP-binding protein [Phycisphaerae bacterium]